MQINSITKGNAEHQSLDNALHKIINNLTEAWPINRAPSKALPLLIVCNNSNLPTPDAFMHFTNAVVIDMKIVGSKTSQPLEVVKKLLDIARERYVPLIIDFPPEQTQLIPSIQQAIHSFSSLLVLFSGGTTPVTEWAFDLVFSPNWMMCQGGMKLLQAILIEKTGDRINVTTNIELMAVQTARRLIATNENPVTTLDLHNTIKPVFNKLLDNCKTHIQNYWPDLNQMLLQKQNLDAFLLGCLMESFEKRSDRILHILPMSSEDAYSKLCNERDEAEFGIELLTKNSRTESFFINQSWFPFDDKRVSIGNQQDQLLATYIKTGILTSIATVSPSHNTLSYFKKFVQEKRPGVIISLSDDGFIIQSIDPNRTSGEANNFSLCTMLNVEGQNIPHLFHFLWRDGGMIPSEQLYYCIKKAESIRNGQPPLVHCLAGLGRTGTFLAAYELYLRFLEYVKEGRKGDFEPDIFSLVLSMNMQRDQMVQNKQQFESLFDFLKYLKQTLSDI